MEEVVIKVRQESQGNAIAETAEKIKQLRAEAEKQRGFADQSAGKFGFNDVTARTARAQAASLEREASRLERPANAAQKAEQRELRNARAEALRADRAGAAEKKAAHKAAADATREAGAQKKADEKLVTRELREQAAVSQARQNAVARGVSAFEGQSGIGGIGRIGAMLNPMTMAAVAIGATIGKAISLAVQRIDDVAEINARGTVSANRRAIIGAKSNGVEAESEASAARLGTKQALEEALANRGSFHNTGIMERMLGTIGMGSGDRAGRKNEMEIARLQQEQGKDDALAQEKFRNGPGGLELGAKEAESTGDRRGARALRHTIEWQKEYNKVLQQTGDLKTASASADLTVFNAEKERLMGAAGKLVNARSGAGDIAAAASSVGGAGQVFAKMQAALDRLHSTVGDNHRDAMTVQRGRKF